MRNALGISVLLALLLAGPPAPAQTVCQTNPGLPGCSPSNPLAESSAGRAWQRITFGAIDCNLGTAASDFCPSDAFSQSGVFGNGTYREIRFLYGGEPLGTPNVADFLSNRVLTQSQTFPSASSASGFTFSWRGGPTPVQDSQMFGPLFGDRGRTNGRNQLSVTFTVQRLKWETLDEAKIRNGEAGLLWGDPDYSVGDDGTRFGYAGRCLMDIDTTMATFALNYGITDRLDLAVAVPVMHTKVQGSNEFVDFAIFPDGSISASPDDNGGFFPQGRFFVQGSSTGVGDVQVTGNYALVKRESGALALTTRVSLGTGSLDKMTGTGETQVRAGLTGSYEAGRVAPHFNASYSWGSEVLFDELSYVFGFDLGVIENRLTLSGEFVGRRLFDVQGFARGDLLGRVRSGVSGESFEVRTYEPLRDDFDLFFATAGGKLRLAGQLLASAYVLIPFGDQGLVAQKPTFNLGFNYAF